MTMQLASPRTSLRTQSGNPSPLATIANRYRLRRRYGCQIANCELRT